MTSNLFQVSLVRGGGLAECHHDQRHVGDVVADGLDKVACGREQVDLAVHRQQRLARPRHVRVRLLDLLRAHKLDRLAVLVLRAAPLRVRRVAMRPPMLVVRRRPAVHDRVCIATPHARWAR